ncbi:MAG: hypothetical protein ACW98Y_17405 [Candidatus Thorarchaeota archaeon]
MSRKKQWWKCNQVKQTISKVAETSVDAIALEIGIEYDTVFTQVKVDLGPKGLDVEKEIVWKGPGDYYFYAKIPYETSALVVINSEDLGTVYFMFEGNASESFMGSHLNPLSEKKSALGMLAADLIPFDVQQWREKIVALMRFTKIEIGSYLKHPVPRGIGYAISELGDIDWRVFMNQADSGEVIPDNPLFSLLKREFEMEKKSHFASSFNKMEIPKYIQVNPRGSQSIISVGSVLPLERGSPNIVATDLTDYEHHSYLAIAPQPSLIKMNYDVLKRLSELAGFASTEYEVNSGVLDTRDTLPNYMAIELERQHRLLDDEPIRMHEIVDQSGNSRGQKILASLKEDEPKLLWPQKLACTNCKAVYKYQASDSQIGKVQCRNCLKYFPANPV